VREGCFEVDVDMVKMPCPASGCDGEVFAARELNEDGSAWQVVWFEEVPVMLCSRSCRTPEELFDLVEHHIRAA
jgi:hypothetical protein